MRRARSPSWQRPLTLSTAAACTLLVLSGCVDMCGTVPPTSACNCLRMTQLSCDPPVHDFDDQLHN